MIQESSTFSHTSNPQPNATQSLTLNLQSNTRAHSAVFQQGLVSGGLVSVQYNQNYLSENSPTNILNPSTAANLQISAQHNLLRGFGIAVNARTIRVSRSNLGIADLTFRAQVITVVNQVISAYFGLASSYEQVRREPQCSGGGRNIPGERPAADRTRIRGAAGRDQRPNAGGEYTAAC